MIMAPRKTSASPSDPDSVSGSDSALYCICRTPYDPVNDRRPFIGCDKCDEWYHYGCVGLSENDATNIKSYICPRCLSKGKTKQEVAQGRQPIITSSTSTPSSSKRQPSLTTATTSNATHAAATSAPLSLSAAPISSNKPTSSSTGAVNTDTKKGSKRKSTIAIERNDDDSDNDNNNGKSPKLRRFPLSSKAPAQRDGIDVGHDEKYDDDDSDSDFLGSDDEEDDDEDTDIIASAALPANQRKQAAAGDSHAEESSDDDEIEREAGGKKNNQADGAYKSATNLLQTLDSYTTEKLFSSNNQYTPYEPVNVARNGMTQQRAGRAAAAPSVVKHIYNALNGTRHHPSGKQGGSDEYRYLKQKLQSLKKKDNKRLFDAVVVDVNWDNVIDLYPHTHTHHHHTHGQLHDSHPHQHLDNSDAVAGPTLKHEQDNHIDGLGTAQPATADTLSNAPSPSPSLSTSSSISSIPPLLPNLSPSPSYYHQRIPTPTAAVAHASASARKALLSHKQLEQVTKQELLDMPFHLLQSNGYVFLWSTNDDITYDFAQQLLDAWGYDYVDEIEWAHLQHAADNEEADQSKDDSDLIPLDPHTTAINHHTNSKKSKHAERLIDKYKNQVTHRCLIGRKGDDPSNLSSYKSDAVVVCSDDLYHDSRHAASKNHIYHIHSSNKPAELYEMIEEMLPNGNFLHLFGHMPSFLISSLRSSWHNFPALKIMLPFAPNETYGKEL